MKIKKHQKEKTKINIEERIEKPLAASIFIIAIACIICIGLLVKERMNQSEVQASTNISADKQKISETQITKMPKKIKKRRQK